MLISKFDFLRQKQENSEVLPCYFTIVTSIRLIELKKGMRAY